MLGKLFVFCIGFGAGFITNKMKDGGFIDGVKTGLFVASVLNKMDANDFARLRDALHPVIVEEFHPPPPPPTPSQRIEDTWSVIR